MNPADHDRKRIGGTAFHEAGHAVVAFIFGRGNLLKKICVADDGRAGRCWFKRMNPDQAQLQPGCNDAYAILRPLAMREIVSAYAGPAAQAHESPREFYPDCKTWLSWLEQGGSIPCEDLDYDQAARVATRITTSYRRAYRLMESAAATADQLVRIPRVRQTITALAENLPNGVILPGIRACKIMHKAFGECHRIPAHELGSEWRKRFDLKSI